jgi:DNA-directed RNA polymerase alpha subunit
MSKSATKFEVKNVKTKELKIEKSKELDNLISLMKKHKTLEENQSGYDLLPKPREETSFELYNTFSGFANAIRRTLTNEVQVYALDTQDIKTDDEFLTNTDVIIKNINLLPLDQYVEDMSKYNIYIAKVNKTLDIVEVTPKDIYLMDRKVFDNTVKDKGVGFKLSESLALFANDHKGTRAKDLVVDDNIVIANLRPGKTLYVGNIQVVSGKGIEDAGKFTLLDNITYNILNVEPYDSFNKTGKRSIEYDPTDFKITFTTSGNIKSKDVMKRCVESLETDLLAVRKVIEDYDKLEESKYFATDKLEVTNKDGIATYKLHKHYFTVTNMIGQRCYLLDPSCPFITVGVERYDTRIGVIKIKHAEPNKIIMDAIDENLKDIKKLLL